MVPEEICRGCAQGSWVSAAHLESCRVFSFCIVPVIALKATDCHRWAETHQFLVDIEQPSGELKSQLKGGLIWHYDDRKLLNSLFYSLSMI